MKGGGGAGAWSSDAWAGFLRAKGDHLAGEATGGVAQGTEGA